MKKAGFFTAVALGAMVMLAPVAAQDLAVGPSGLADTDASKQRKPRDGGGAIVLGDGVDGSLSRGTNTYVMQGRAGQRVRISLSSPRFDTVLRISGPNGFSAENDDAPGGATLDSMLEAVLPADGSYELVVSAFNGQGSGEYRLATMDPANPAPGGARPIAFGEAATGMLTPSDPTSFTGQYVDYYAFAGRAGQRVTFDLGSEDIDTLLTVYLPDGRQEMNDDRNGTANTDSLLSITLPTDGTYHVAASSFSPGEAGRYGLTVREAEAGVRTVRPSTGNSRVFALTVGVADYERISPLDRTDEDAERVSAALRSAGVLAPESVTLLNSRATRANFQAALTDLTNAMGEEDLLLIFYSGHGEKVENMTTEHDGSAETMELFDAPLYDYELAAMMENIDARTLLVIDACFAGGFDNVIDQRVDRMGIFSSDEDTLSLVATREKAGGHISHIFRQAIEGGADLDGDREVTAGELSEFMRRQFYRAVLEAPLATDAEDFRDMQVPGWQHIVIDRGGDGMPHQQVLMNLAQPSGGTLARAN
ncbi:MAG: pre-peptidase C-terminal domain-containing protein [Erythrobacter sp.]|nr:MAG: pre-peptidase C-terminal domain-containing protein [Erythrobacter sp.]